MQGQPPPTNPSLSLPLQGREPDLGRGETGWSGKPSGGKCERARADAVARSYSDAVGVLCSSRTPPDISGGIAGRRSG